MQRTVFPKQEWVQCERCEKWRSLPSWKATSDLPDKWSCHMNTWDANQSRCDQPELGHSSIEKSTSSANVFVVGALLDVRCSKKKKSAMEFHVRWQGYGEEDDTWEPEGNLRSLASLFQTQMADLKRGHRLPSSSSSSSSSLSLSATPPLRQTPGVHGQDEPSPSSETRRGDSLSSQQWQEQHGPHPQEQKTLKKQKKAAHSRSQSSNKQLPFSALAAHPLSTMTAAPESPTRHAAAPASSKSASATAPAAVAPPSAALSPSGGEAGRGGSAKSTASRETCEMRVMQQHLDTLEEQLQVLREETGTMLPLPEKKGSSNNNKNNNSGVALLAATTNPLLSLSSSSSSSKSCLAAVAASATGTSLAHLPNSGRSSIPKKKKRKNGSFSSHHPNTNQQQQQQQQSEAPQEKPREAPPPQLSDAAAHCIYDALGKLDPERQMGAFDIIMRNTCPPPTLSAGKGGGEDASNDGDIEVDLCSLDTGTLQTLQEYLGISLPSYVAKKKMQPMAIR
mmetsp:Transcript_17948/g.36785  ORF Transcript_17948/g.36785 Transcript_17948/m.36785 type:complete len:508 (-) Transcript_17948:295-1818(-)